MSTWMEQIRLLLEQPRPERDPILVAGSGPGAALRQAAVLIPLYVRDKELWTLLTKRTETVEHHKGQISFPGGGKEPHDENLWQTAIRETEEEIGVPKAGVRLLGALPKFVTVTDFEVFPFVGAIPYPVAFKKAEGEVESILEIPVSYLLNPQVVETRPVVWRGKSIETVIYHYSGHAIWGATAHILTDLLDVMREGSSSRS